MATYKKLLKNRNGDNIIPVTQIINDYSTSEVDTGCTWIDGKHIYKKTIDFGTLPNASSKAVSHGISNLDTVIKCEAFSKDSNNIQRPIPYTHIGSGLGGIVLDVKNSIVQIFTDSDRSTFYTYVTLYYTKTS